MRKKANGPKRSPLGEGGGSPLGPDNPLPRGLVPHGEGRRVPPPLAYIRRGRVPLFHHSIKFFSSLFLPPSSDSPCLEFALGRGFLHHTHVIVLTGLGSESVFFPLLASFGAWREHRLRRTCVIP